MTENGGPEYLLYFPSIGWIIDGRRATEEEAKARYEEAGIPFLVEEDSIEMTFLLDTRVAGSDWVPDIGSVIEGMKAGDLLGLEREPHNRYDSCAIQVLRGDDRIGYLPRADNTVISSLMDSGHHLLAIVEGSNRSPIRIKVFMRTIGRRPLRHFAPIRGCEYPSGAVAMYSSP